MDYANHAVLWKACGGGSVEPKQFKDVFGRRKCQKACSLLLHISAASAPCEIMSRALQGRFRQEKVSENLCVVAPHVRVCAVHSHQAKHFRDAFGRRKCLRNSPWSQKEASRAWRAHKQQLQTKVLDSFSRRKRVKMPPLKNVLARYPPSTPILPFASNLPPPPHPSPFSLPLSQS